jgi:hypothetical protein
VRLPVTVCARLRIQVQLWNIRQMSLSTTMCGQGHLTKVSHEELHPSGGAERESTARIYILTKSDLKLIEAARIPCLCKAVFGTEREKSSSAAFNTEPLLRELGFIDNWIFPNPNNSL